MAQPNPIANPFALMMTPEVVFAAIERSERLGRLKSRICRPLDGPRPPQVPPEVSSFDAAVDAAPEVLEVLEWPVIEGEGVAASGN
jgi:hypothetical protein